MALRKCTSVLREKDVTQPKTGHGNNRKLIVNNLSFPFLAVCWVEAYFPVYLTYNGIYCFNNPMLVIMKQSLWTPDGSVIVVSGGLSCLEDCEPPTPKKRNLQIQTCGDWNVCQKDTWLTIYAALLLHVHSAIILTASLTECVFVVSRQKIKEISPLQDWWGISFEFF